MKILVPVLADTIEQRDTKWKSVLDKLASLPAGYALPIECDTREEAQQLQGYIFQKQNSKQFSGTRYQCTRRKNVLYIIQAVNGSQPQNGSAHE
jgi:hypothetical protein